MAGTAAGAPRPTHWASWKTPLERNSSSNHWSSHRYQVYLSFMHAVAHQAASTYGWPSGAFSDLLEYAPFNAAW
ncbi:hypothetical protein ACWDU8_03900 [Streptomyces sp. NPDC003388]